MLAKKLKRPNTDERKAFHYFGFDGIVPFEHVNSRINELKEEFADDERLERIHEHVEQIESYFDSEELRNDDTISQKFNKDKRRQKWQSYKKDFKDFEFKVAQIIEDAAAEAAEAEEPAVDEEELVDAEAPVVEETEEEVVESEDIEEVEEEVVESDDDIEEDADD